MPRGGKRPAKGQGKHRWRGGAARINAALDVTTIRRHTPLAVRARAIQDAWKAAPKGGKTKAVKAACAALGLSPRQGAYHIKRLKEGKVCAATAAVARGCPQPFPIASGQPTQVPLEGRGRLGPVARGEEWVPFAKVLSCPAFLPCFLAPPSPPCTLLPCAVYLG